MVSRVYTRFILVVGGVLDGGMWCDAGVAGGR